MIEQPDGGTMSTPTYVIKRIADQYIPVREEPDAAAGRAGWVLGGALALALGIRRGRLLGTAAAAVGGAMIVRGLLNFSPACLLIGYLSRNGPSGDPSLAPSYQNDAPRRAPQQPADLVDEQSMESFPASDPPARAGAPRI